MHKRRKDLNYYLNHKSNKKAWISALIIALVLIISTGAIIWTHPQIIGDQALAANVTPNSIINTFYKPKRRPVARLNKPKKSPPKHLIKSPRLPLNTSTQNGNYTPPQSALLPSNIFADGLLCSIKD